MKVEKKTVLSDCAWVIVHGLGLKVILGVEDHAKVTFFEREYQSTIYFWFF